MPYAKHTRSSQRNSFQTSPIAAVPSTSTPSNIPISISNKQLVDEARRMSRAHDRNTHLSNMDGRTSRNSRRSREGGVKAHHDRDLGHHKTVSVNNVPAYEVVAIQNVYKMRWVVTEQQPTTQYIRPTGSELVSSKIPSCIGLPPSWTYIHDRFIAYLATHAPLDRNGKVPKHEEREERWKTEEIVREVGERFPELGGSIKATMIEKRLALLDLAGDNDYFKIPYGAYVYEEWGRGI